MATIKAQITLTDTTAAAIRALDSRGRLSEGIETLYRDYMRGTVQPKQTTPANPDPYGRKTKAETEEKAKSDYRLAGQIAHYERFGEAEPWEDSHKDLTPAMIEAAIAVYNKNKAEAMQPGSDYQRQLQKIAAEKAAPQKTNTPIIRPWTDKDEARWDMAIAEGTATEEAKLAVKRRCIVQEIPSTPRMPTLDEFYAANPLPTDDEGQE